MGSSRRSFLNRAASVGLAHLPGPPKFRVPPLSTSTTFAPRAPGSCDASGRPNTSIFSFQHLQKGVPFPAWVSAVPQENDLRRYPRVASPKGTFLAWSTASHRLVSRLQNFPLSRMLIRVAEPLPPATYLQFLLHPT